MGNEVIFDKYRDEDANERRRKSRRRFKIGGRRSTDNKELERKKNKSDRLGDMVEMDNGAFIGY